MFECLKNWGDYKKGDPIDLSDKTVIEKALELGVIKKVTKTKKEE